ncbi:CvpA family protein [Microbacterium gilvum]|uniref:ABC transporter n=1 Tax=Microbacterium gilvum TaxID=1336204 RepID=A0ABP9A9E3_9MICO
MSDAQGSARDPRTGDPIEESADVDSTDAVESATAADAHDVHHADASDASPSEPEQRSAAADTPDEVLPSTASREPEATPAAAADAEPEPAAAPAAAATPADATPAGTSSTPVDNDGDGEPDYAALAAELEEFERRHAAATGAPLTAPEPADVETAPRRDPWFEPAETKTFSTAEPVADPEPAVTASEPVVPAAAVAPAAPQPIFVQAPEPPKVRGNRGAAGLIGLVAALVFAVLYAAATIGWLAFLGQVDLSTIGTVAVQLATSASLWVPVIVFWLGFWLLGALVNRARWGTWVTLGFFVGVIAYGGHLLGQLFAAPFWMLSPDQGQALVVTALVSPVAIAAFVIAREITIWFGAWAARRGAKVSAQNAEAQEEYERTLEAGPQLSA